MVSASGAVTCSNAWYRLLSLLVLVGTGAMANAAATATMVIFFSMLLPRNILRQFSAVPCKRLTLRRHRRQRHYSLGVVARGDLRRAHVAQRRRGVAAMLVGQWTARCVGASCRAGRLGSDLLGAAAAAYPTGAGARHGLEQRPRVGMGAMREQIFRAPLLDDPAEIHHRDLVAEIIH